MKYLKVGDNYTYNGYTLTVNKREGDICLASNPDYGFEVFRIKHRKATKLPNGTISEPGEYPPSTSEFGRHAYHWLPKYRNLAVKDFDNMVKKYSSVTQEVSAKG